MIIAKRKWLLLVSIIAIVGFLGTFYISIFEITTNTSTTIPFNETDRRESQPIPPFIGAERRIPFYILPLSSILLTVATVSISYYFISIRLEKGLEKRFDVISKILQKNNSVSKTPAKQDSKNVILKFLNNGERKVVEKLIEKKGEILQSEITRMEDMNKLKTHRAVKDLERKGIIKRESHGKTHLIILSKDIKDAILK
jgi:uncharacterized membrane protein